MSNKPVPHRESYSNPLVQLYKGREQHVQNFAPKQHVDTKALQNNPILCSSKKCSPLYVHLDTAAGHISGPSAIRNFRDLRVS